jgi:hypothetical protein
VEATAKTTVDIEPALKKTLIAKLARLKTLQDAADAAQATADKAKKVVDGYFEQVGANSINIDGHATITEVRGTSSKLDKVLFVKNGGSLQVLEDSTVTTPKKPYVLVTFAKEGK